MKTNNNKTARIFLPILKPRSHVSVLVESGDFSCCLACRPHASVKTVLVEKRIFSKTLRSRVASRLRVDGRKRRFLNTMMSYIILFQHETNALSGMLWRISIVLAISCGRSKKIRMRYAVHVDTYIFENGGKKSSFSKISGCLSDGA